MHVGTNNLLECGACDTFSRNHEPNRLSQTNLSYSLNMPIYFPSGIYKLLIRSFLEYCNMIVNQNNISYFSLFRTHQ